MRRSIIISTAAILTALALSGCAAGLGASDSANESGGFAPQEQVVEGVAPAPGDSIALDSDGSVSGTEREVITTGYVTITVESPQDAAAEAIRITEAAGGRVDGRSEYAPRGEDGGSATLTLRVPSKDLTRTLDQLRELGDVQEVSLNSSDVTMESRDLDARISALSASVDRLLALLASASDTDTLIQLETAISDRQAQLESLESQRRLLSDQVSLSTIQLNLVTEQVVPDPEPADFFSGIVTGWNAFVAFFSGLIVVVGVLLPWLIFGALIAGIVILIVRSRRRKVAPKEAEVNSPEKVSSPE